jgi:hypothetical protein
VQHLTRKAGTIDVSATIRIIDSTDGTPETGVVFNTAGIDIQYRREGAVSSAITEVSLADAAAAHADGGFVHIGNGYYRVDLPDAACAVGATGVLVHGTVTGMIVVGCYITLVAYDPFDTVRLGLTALPNAASEALGGLYTRGSGAGQINQPANGRIDVNMLAAAADSIDSSALATTAVTEIAQGVMGLAVSGNTAAGTFGEAINNIDLRGARTVCRGTVGSATTPTNTQFTPSALTPAGGSVDQFKGRVIVFDIATTTVALRGVATDITASANAALPLLTFSVLPAAPASGDTFSIV